MPPVAVTLPTSPPSTKALTRSPHPVNPISVDVVADANPHAFPVCQALPIVETNVTQPLTPTSYQVSDVHQTAPTSFLTSEAHPIVTTRVTQQPSLPVHSLPSLHLYDTSTHDSLGFPRSEMDCSSNSASAETDFRSFSPPGERRISRLSATLTSNG